MSYNKTVSNSKTKKKRNEVKKMEKLKITAKIHFGLIESLKAMTFEEDEMVYNEVIEVYNNLNVFYFMGTDFSARVELEPTGYKVDVIYEEGYKAGQIAFTCTKQSPEDVIEIIENCVAIPVE